MEPNISEAQRSRSPTPPPWSPISPNASTTALTDLENHQSVNLPPNIPIAESTNTDVIALRAALGVLQMQRLQSIRNIQTLDKQRNLALAHPEEFRQGLFDGTIHSQRDAESIFDENDDKDDDGSQHEDDDASTSTGKGPPSPLKDFGAIPAALHVVRCPPVNWTKYHIAGDILDQLHEQQRRLPASGHSLQSVPSRPHAIAAPYSPWHDKFTDITTKSPNSGPP